MGYELTSNFPNCPQKSLLELCLEALEFFGVVCASIWPPSFLLTQVPILAPIEFAKLSLTLDEPI